MQTTCPVVFDVGAVHPLQYWQLMEIATLITIIQVE